MINEKEMMMMKLYSVMLPDDDEPSNITSSQLPYPDDDDMIDSTLIASSASYKNEQLIENFGHVKPLSHINGSDKTRIEFFHEDDASVQSGYEDNQFNSFAIYSTDNNVGSLPNVIVNIWFVVSIHEQDGDVPSKDNVSSSNIDSQVEYAVNNVNDVT